jgi:hypothetical protein
MEPRYTLTSLSNQVDECQYREDEEGWETIRGESGRMVVINPSVCSSLGCGRSHATKTRSANTAQACGCDRPDNETFAAERGHHYDLSFVEKRMSTRSCRSLKSLPTSPKVKQRPPLT